MPEKDSYELERAKEIGALKSDVHGLSRTLDSFKAGVSGEIKELSAEVKEARAAVNDAVTSIKLAEQRIVQAMEFRDEIKARIDNIEDKKIGPMCDKLKDHSRTLRLIAWVASTAVGGLILVLVSMAMNTIWPHTPPA